MANYSDPYEEWKAQGRPGGSFSAWQGGQRPMQETVGLPSIPQQTQYAQPQPMAYTGVPTIEQMRAQTAASGASEDFQRFQQGDIDRWGQYYDAAASARAGRPQFRSGRGQAGFFDKPTECPPGMVPGGPNETDGCVGTPDSAQASSFSTAQPAAPAYGASVPGLTQMMAGLPAATVQPTQPLAQAIGPYQGGFQSGTAGFQSATGGAFNKLTQATKQAAQPQGMSIGTGWSQGQDGLTQMMAKRQKPGQSSQGWWM